MGLNAKQKEAVEYLEGPLLVLAGPGTGKTQLLSEKVAYILKNMDVQPENILCMTFTDAGVRNMEERLKTIIGPEGAKVRVATYHKFGSEILGEYQNYSEKYERRLEESVDVLKRFKIVREIQRSLPGDDILQKDNVDDIVNTISAAKAAKLTGEDLAAIAKQNIEDAKVLAEQISPLLLNVVPRRFKESYERAYAPIYELLKDYTEAPVILKNIERSIGEMARDLKVAIAEAEGSESISPLTKWKEKYFENDEFGGYRLKDRIKNKKLASFAKVMEKYARYLEENGLYDFDDMILEAGEVLRTDGGFKAMLSERYQFIMLDEFQDTNPAQFEIIKQLTDYEKPLIMAVGDDDQAIYEFQGALSTNLTDFQRHYASHVVALTENYRSTQEILDFSRQIINKATDRFADKELTAHKESFPDSRIYRYEFLSSELEYDFVAQEVAKLVAEGVPQSEIAVIARKHKYFMPLLPFLKAHSELKIAYEKRDNLFEDEQIHQILTICRYVYELANERRVDTNILEILSYPFWELSPVEVLKVVGGAKAKKVAAFEEICECSVERIREIGEFLAKLVSISFTEPLGMFLNYVIGEAEVTPGGFRSPFLRYYTAQGEMEGFTLYENLAILLGKIREHFGEKKLRLADLIEMLKDYDEAGMAMTASSPYRDAEEAVQILTAHSAKGLEFRYVFILGADDNAWGKGKGNNNMLALPANLAQIRHTGTTEGERLRILYVALTRAKEAIYITNSLRSFEEKNLRRLEYFEEYEKDGEIVSPFLPSRKVIKIEELESRSGVVDSLKHWLTPYIVSNPDMRAVYKERARGFRMSATALTLFIDVFYGGPQEFFKSYILQVPFGGESESLAFGNLVHQVFEAVTNKGLSDEEAVAMFKEELSRKDLAEDVLKRMEERGALDLQVALKRFGDILRVGQAEVDLAGERLVIEGVPVTGKIDHLVIDEEAKTVEIYDFKTGGFKNEDWKKNNTYYKYMLQLMFYKLLLGVSSKYKDYTVSRAHVLFVTPDDDGEVHEKTLEFSGEDEAKLVELMKAVYSQVLSLEFMDDPELFIEPDRQQKVGDLVKFIDLVIQKSNLAKGLGDGK